MSSTLHRQGLLNIIAESRTSTEQGVKKFCFQSIPGRPARCLSSSISFSKVPIRHVPAGLSVLPRRWTPKTSVTDALSRRGVSVLLVSASAEGGKQAWDFGRFLQTVFYFNEPPSLDKVMRSVVATLSGQGGANEVAQGAPKDVVLVVGGTGGVGKRVVDVLRTQGYAVRAMVRNAEKARKLLGPDVELVFGDLTQPQTLLPDHFRGVSRVINCASVLVGPKEGDTQDRQKYYQVKGDTPEAVEYEGMRNLIGALGEQLGVRGGKPLFAIDASGSPQGPAWGALDDVVMGGVSESGLQIDRRGGEDGGPVGVFKGRVSTSNNGGFASIRTKNFTPLQDLSAYGGLRLRVKGDGRRYKIIIRTTTDWDAVGYTVSFGTKKGDWQWIDLPFSSFPPVFRAKSVQDAPPLDPSRIASLQLMYSKFESDGKLNPEFEAGEFELPVASISSYLSEPLTPRFVHVGSAGVTRPDRPGLDLSKQPPAVRMNKELGGILTFKLKGEDVLRGSGVPYAVIRPCALTEEPAGAELLFDQGDNMTGKIGREEVARICVAALSSPAATDKTFEVKSTVPFSQPFEVDPANPPPPTNYTPFFEALKDGVTGKELLGKEPVSVT